MVQSSFIVLVTHTHTWTIQWSNHQGRSTHNGLYGHGCIILPNNTSISKPHPIPLQTWDWFVASLVHFLAEKFPKFPIILTILLISISGRNFSEKKQVIKTATFSELALNNGCVYHYTFYVKTPCTALFVWMLLELGVSMGMAFVAV